MSQAKENNLKAETCPSQACVQRTNKTTPFYATSVASQLLSTLVRDSFQYKTDRIIISQLIQKISSIHYQFRQEPEQGPACLDVEPTPVVQRSVKPEFHLTSFAAPPSEIRLTHTGFRMQAKSKNQLIKMYKKVNVGPSMLIKLPEQSVQRVEDQAKIQMMRQAKSKRFNIVISAQKNQTKKPKEAEFTLEQLNDQKFQFSFGYNGEPFKIKAGKQESVYQLPKYNVEVQKTTEMTTYRSFYSSVPKSLFKGTRHSSYQQEKDQVQASECNAKQQLTLLNIMLDTSNVRRQPKKLPTMRKMQQQPSTRRRKEGQIHIFNKMNL